MIKTLIVGHGGREAALSEAMAAGGSQLHAVVAHANPSIVRAVERSGGAWTAGKVTDAEAVAAFASSHGIELAMVSADDPLAAGVVDALQAAGIRTVGPTRDGARIEWDKEFSRAIVADVHPSANPRTRGAHTVLEVERIFEEFGDAPVAVKPTGLTGGKGVKVMGPHLADHAEAAAYARSIIEDNYGGGAVLVEDRIDGPEFTIQAITDGETVVFPPSTYDYPYRYDGDTGPGTGGMGSLSLAETTLPFMTEAHYAEACEVIEKVIGRLRADGRHFSGIMNSGFFATADGVKAIEFNARFGDPEAMNILTLFDGNWIETMEAIHARRLTAADVPLKPHASVVVYLVSPDYALRSGGPYEFSLDVDEIAAMGCRVFFSSAVQSGGEHRYTTVGTSRAVAIACSAPTLQEAFERAHAAAATVEGPLEHRSEIGSPQYLGSL